MLSVANALDVPSVINKYIKSPRQYCAKKPVRNNLTPEVPSCWVPWGECVCLPAKEDGGIGQRRHTAEYLLRHSLSKIDSQHFWDLMDALPEESIAEIEARIN
ncbi:hypothetical protein [Candidatus Kuenenia stuttgartiensis]|uniref:hypothetical protein n=1 Tax=Kuenenia stuttgartiensis TaxID=174633 RepID=UPI00146A938F|nr:hypothetical protein [Candidatus Kuenenia stuttgartiensis]